MTEAELQAAVIDLARLLGWRVAHFRPALTARGWRTPVTADGAGWPDLVLVRDRVLYVELKTAKGKLSVEQRVWRAALEGCGEEFHVWRPEHWRDGRVERVLRARAAA